MNWPWADSLEQIWHSQVFPTWLTLAAAGFFGLIVLVTLLRADKSVANGALTVIALLGAGIAVASTTRGFDAGDAGQGGSSQSPAAMVAATPALACVDDLAGEAVLTPCEKSLFGSAEAVAAAVSYASWQLHRLTAYGDVANAEKNLTPEIETLRRAVEHDRYGLMAYVLTVRDHCTSADCVAFRTLTDHRRIAANMDERLYDNLVLRYAPTWGLPAVSASATPVAALVPGVPTGRPTNAEFPSASSTPPVSIMTPEPTASTSSAPRSASPGANAPATASPRPAAPASPAVAAAKKPAAPKPPRAASAPAPVAIAPAAASPAPASAPAASNE
jgi:hypothetical protein